MNITWTVARRVRLCGLAVGLLAGPAAVAQITTNTWAGPSGGDWFNGANWSAGQPVAGQHVAVTNAAHSLLLTSETPALASLTMTGGTLIFSNWTTRLRAAEVTLGSASKLTLPLAFTELQMSNRVWIVCSNLTVAAGAAIDISGKGFAGGPLGFDGYGPGKGRAGANGRAGGGGHGGRGGWGLYITGNWSMQGGASCGDATDPVLPGSGGGTMSYPGSGGGAGGGAVRIEATGDVVVDGMVAANGFNAQIYSGGGSGGGISIACARFGGTGGSITANGGALGVDSGGGGGGGRIAVRYASLIGTPSVRFEARESPGLFPMWHAIDRWTARWLSEYGTLWFSDAQFLSTTLDNLSGRIIIPDFTVWSPASLTVSNAVVGLGGGLSLNVAGELRVGAGGALDIGDNGRLACGDRVFLDGGRLVLNVFTQMVCGADLVVTNGGQLYAYSAATNGTAAFGASVDVAGDIRIGPASWILPDTCPTNGGAPRFRCRSAIIADGGGFDGDGRGFWGGYFAQKTGYGPGAGKSTSYGSGGGYGGRGGYAWENTVWGRAGGTPYGLSNGLFQAGSGGGSYSAGYGGSGGGLIWLEARESAVLDGVLSANGGTAFSYSGGGSGGGVFVCARQVSGSASAILRANGGDGASERGGPGGGGRIAVAIGLDDAAREALVSGGVVPGLYTYFLDAAYRGTLNVAVGTSFDYAGAEAYAPQPGSFLFVTTNVTLNILGSPENHGHPAPAGYGAWSYLAAGTWITNSVVTPDDEASGLRHACIGWRLEDADGAFVAEGAGTQAVFQLPATRLLRWNWTNEYLLAVHEGLNGTVTTELSGWYTNATGVADITATPASGYVFDRWIGDFPEGGETANPLSVTMDQPRTLTPVFASAAGLDKDWVGGVGTWESAGNWSPPGMPGSYDRVTVTSGTAIVNLPRQTLSVAVGNGGSLLFTNWVASLIASNVTIGSGGFVRLPPAFTDAQMSNRVSLVCANLTVAHGGTIDVSGKGYAGGPLGFDGYGPGKGKGASQGRAGGGGHGGRGGWGVYLTGSWSTQGGASCGDAADPVLPGSGGGTTGYAGSGGGAGGGAVRIEATGDVVIDGTVTANGANALQYSGGGSGGSVYIACARFGGSGGSISANGGARGYGDAGGGGGGRIAVHYDSLIGTPSVRFEARESPCVFPMWHTMDRWTARWLSEYGTLWFSDASFLSTTLDNLSGRIIIPGFTVWSPASLTVSNAVVGLGGGLQLNVAGELRVGAGGALDLWDNGRLACNDQVVLDGGRLVLNVFTQMVCGADLVLTNGGRLYAYSAATNGTAAFGASVDVAGDIRIGSASWIHPDTCPTNGGAPRFRCRNAVIAAGGGFNGDARGFWGGLYTQRTGCGPGAAKSSSYGAGGGYGGRGGDAWDNTKWGAVGGSSYGLSNALLQAGSGGSTFQSGWGGHGGGLVWIDAQGTFVLDGALSANGESGFYYSGGGSGGGIFVCSQRFSGSAGGTLSANGGNGASARGGPGGGGRIVVAVGLTAAERDRLQTGQAHNLRIAASHVPYAGLPEADAGVLGADYTGAPEHAPQPGSVLFIKSAGGMILLIR